MVHQFVVLVVVSEGKESLVRNQGVRDIVGEFQCIDIGGMVDLLVDEGVHGLV